MIRGISQLLPSAAAARAFGAIIPQRVDQLARTIFRHLPFVMGGLIVSAVIGLAVAFTIRRFRGHQEEVFPDRTGPPGGEIGRDASPAPLGEEPPSETAGPPGGAIGRDASPAPLGEEPSSETALGSVRAEEEGDDCTGLFGEDSPGDVGIWRGITAVPRTGTTRWSHFIAVERAQ